MTPEDQFVVDAFTNFLSWGQAPAKPKQASYQRFEWPPAVWGYAIGATSWCPPIGEM